MTAAGTTCRVFGIDCFVGDLDHASALVVDRARSGKGGFASLMNVHVAMTANRDRVLWEALDSAWAVFPDGAPIAWLERRAGASTAVRTDGPALMLRVLGESRDLRHFFLGSTGEVVARLERRVTAAIPGLSVAGTLSPAFGTEHDPAVLEAVRSARADVLWVALGAPKQELWANRHAAELVPALVLGVGAAFDFHAGTKPRAPAWMQRSGLEWLHRLAHEPRRLVWRYLSTNTLFALAVLRGAARQ